MARDFKSLVSTNSTTPAEFDDSRIGLVMRYPDDKVSTTARWRSGNAAVCKTDMHGFDSRPGLKIDQGDFGLGNRSCCEIFKERSELKYPQRVLKL